MASVTAALASNPGLAPNSYIYKIISTAPRRDPYTYTTAADQLAIISSDDSLRFLDPSTLSLLPDGLVKNVHQSVTCLERTDDPASNIISTAGRDGLIKFWDKRSRKSAVMTIQSPHKLISSLVCNNPRNFIAAGIENPEDGPHESPVYVWDARQPSAPTLSLVESHTDTVTTLALHPSHPTLLLSSSTDGLINLFDTSAPEEEDALYQVINHRSAVAHAGFLYPSTDIYALGTDETVGFYALQSQKEDEEEPAPRLCGDVRDKLGCEYLVEVVGVGSEVVVAAGKHSSSSLSLIPVTRTGPEPLAYEFDLSRSITLAGAHGEEIVRDMFTDLHTNTTYTAGEDGHIRAWRMPVSVSAPATMDIDEPATVKSDKKSKDKDADKKERREKRKEKKEKRKGDKEKERFKPY